MQIFQGFRSPSEIGSLADAGADEFYTGYDAFRPAPLRNHYPAEFGLTCPAELERAAALVHEKGGKLFVAINQAFYGISEVRHYPGHVRRLADMGVDGVVVCSVPLLLALKEAQNTLEVCLSTLQPVFNAGALDFFKKLGVDRVVFPEHTAATEVAEVLAREDVRCESFFWLSHDCANVEAFCLFHHHCYRYMETVRGSGFDYCRSRPTVRPSNGGEPRLAATIEAGFAAPQRYKINGMGNLYDYARGGLDYLKMGNRPMPLEHKLLLLGIARELTTLLADNGIDRDEFVARGHELAARALHDADDSMLRKMYPWYFN